jgi:PAS domain-containing protein
MILRIVLGRFPPDRGADVLLELREQLAEAARPIAGLESLMVGARQTSATADAGPAIEAAIVTIWVDAERMLRATSEQEQERFLAGRLRLPFVVVSTDYFEIVDRTFAALPSERLSLLRILRVRARSSDESRLIATLRGQQQRFVDLGLIASHLGRRITPEGQVEAVGVRVWPDRDSIQAATGGRPETPLFADELAEWADTLSLELFDGVEILPRLPSASGPPMFVLDGDWRIVDVTPTAAALLGLPAVDLVGQRAAALVDDGHADWATTLLTEGAVSGEAAWQVPEVGEVLIRYAARRDVPIPGRHAVVVARWHDPGPTSDDFDRAVAEAFPGRDATA